MHQFVLDYHLFWLQSGSNKFGQQYLNQHQSPRKNLLTFFSVQIMLNNFFPITGDAAQTLQKKLKLNLENPWKILRITLTMKRTKFRSLPAELVKIPSTTSSVGKKLENLKLDSLGNFKTNRVLDSKILKLQNLNSTRLASIFEFYHNSSIFEENSNYFDL